MHPDSELSTSIPEFFKICFFFATCWGVVVKGRVYCVGGAGSGLLVVGVVVVVVVMGIFSARSNEQHVSPCVWKPVTAAILIHYTHVLSAMLSREENTRLLFFLFYYYYSKNT